MKAKKRFIVIKAVRMIVKIIIRIYMYDYYSGKVHSVNAEYSKVRCRIACMCVAIDQPVQTELTQSPQSVPRA